MAVSLALREPQPMIEMNMTPLVDVLLVLIIMFIITIPIQSHAVKLDLPQGSPLPSDAQHNLLTIAPDGMARWNGVAADDATLMATCAPRKRCSRSPNFTCGPMPWRATSGSTKCWR